MAIVVTLDGAPLLDSSTGDGSVIECSVTQNENESAWLDIELPHGTEVAERSSRITVDWDGEIVFAGRVESVGESIGGTMTASASSDLHQLAGVSCRPHSTDGSVGVICPSTMAAYVEWLIAQYNSVTMGGRIEVGVNQADSLSVAALSVASDSWPTVAERLTDMLGDAGHLEFSPNGRGGGTLDIWADVHEAANQIIDFGENVTALTVTRGSEDPTTAVVPTIGSKTVDMWGDEAQALLISAGYRTRGTAVVDEGAASRYGYYESVVEFDNDVGELDAARATIAALSAGATPGVTVECSAVDMAWYSNAKPLRVGQAARVRCAPLGIDEYMVVQGIRLDIADPASSTYTLGVAYDSLTGQQSAFMRSANAAITATHEAASAAIISQVEEFYQSTSPTELEGGMWSTDSTWGDGTYTWRRTLVTYGNGDSEYVPGEGGVCVAGNDGRDGEDAILLCIEADNGTAFRNSDGSTTLHAVVRVGGEALSTLAEVRQSFGETARIVWKLRALGGTVETLDGNDPRLSELGMALTLTPADVDEGATAFAELTTD